MKTRQQILEELHDETLEDLIRTEAKLRITEGLADDDPVPGYGARGFGGQYVPVTKKDFTEKHTAAKAVLEKLLESVKKLISEEHDKAKQ